MALCLLDTDTLSEILKQKHPALVERASAYLRQHEQFAFSSMTRYEVVRGLKDKGASRQLQQFETFCAHSLILGITDAILDGAADLWVEAHRGGLPRNDADLIIAATALAHGRALITGNTTHFSWIPGLEIEDWRQP